MHACDRLWIVCRSQLARTHQQSHTAAADNREILAQLEAVEHENYEITEYLRQELESRDEKIAELHTRIEEVGSQVGLQDLELFSDACLSELG